MKADVLSDRKVAPAVSTNALDSPKDGTATAGRAPPHASATDLLDFLTVLLIFLFVP